jgi:glycosyltransferase involved in cell wall biosynthesis
MTGPLSGVRVVIVNNFPGELLGGGEVLTLHVCDGLLAAGAELHAVVMPRSELGARLRTRQVRVTEIPMSMSSLPTTLRALRMTLDGAHTGMLFGTGYFTNVLVRLAARGQAGTCAINLVQVVPGASRLDGGSRLSEWLRRLVDRLTRQRVHAFIAVSEAVAVGLREAGADSSRVHVVPNAVDVVALEAAVSDELPDGLPGGTGALVVCAARLEAVKGVEYLLRAMVLVPGARLAVIGDGSQRNRLATLISDLEIADRVALLGYMPQIAPLLAAADVVALPSLSEGLPMAALEAMALGRPVVATRVGGVPEAVEDGVTGLLVAPAEPKALAMAIQSLLDDPVRAERMGALARERVIRCFSVEHMAAEYVRVVSELVSE